MDNNTNLNNNAIIKYKFIRSMEDNKINRNVEDTELIDLIESDTILDLPILSDNELNSIYNFDLSSIINETQKKTSNIIVNSDIKDIKKIIRQKKINIASKKCRDRFKKRYYEMETYIGKLHTIVLSQKINNIDLLDLINNFNTKTDK